MPHGTMPEAGSVPPETLLTTRTSLNLELVDEYTETVYPDVFFVACSKNAAVEPIVFRSA